MRPDWMPEHDDLDDDGPDPAAEAIGALIDAMTPQARAAFGGIAAGTPAAALILLTDWHTDEATDPDEAARYAVDLVERLAAAGFRITAR